jgi:hypothetical protein
MKTLTLFFRELDTLIAQYPTFTKVNFFGSCYIEAGGIFDEYNQPQDHSSKILRFGLKAIMKINQSFQLNLQIRAVIDTGGSMTSEVLLEQKCHRLKYFVQELFVRFK